MEGGNKVPESIIPCPPFIAVGRLVIFCIYETAQLLPPSYRKTYFDFWRI